MSWTFDVLTFITNITPELALGQFDHAALVIDGQIRSSKRRV